MQRKTEKGELGRVLSCMRMALYNESIAEMARKLEISPTYLNSIECEIRPCTFKILENIFAKYVFNPEIEKLKNPNFTPENVLNCAWNGGLYTTFGVPITPKMTLDLLLEKTSNKPELSLEIMDEKEKLLEKLQANANHFDDIPNRFFADANFVEKMQQSAKLGLNLEVQATEISDELISRVTIALQKISKKTTTAIKKCGKCKLQLAKMLTEISPTTAKIDETFDYSKRGA